MNLVKHSATSPSISTAMSSSYPPPPQNMSQTYSPYGQNPYGQPMGYPMNNYYGGNHMYQGAYYPQYYPGGPPNMPPTAPTPAPAGGGMFTRNLIGSLSASAFRLNDPDDKIGVWFILQDLSVRTEGVFRYVVRPLIPTGMGSRLTTCSLKMSFVNVGLKTDPDAPPVVNHGSAPVLATVFSEPFQVFSAKKFPGVIESTQLSKCFALQGIKIPIRKDGVKGRRGADDDDGDDYD